MQKTNELTEHEKQEHAKEAIILKGIATSINAMAFPQFKHLDEMLNNFGKKIISNDVKYENIFEFYAGNRQTIQNIHLHKYELSQNSNEEYNVLNYSVLEKKLLLIETLFNYSSDKTTGYYIDNVEKYNIEYTLLCNIISKNIKIGICNLPIFIHLGNTYSVDKMEFDSILEFNEFLKNLKINICVHYFQILHDERILLKYAVLNK
jgi:hypothetical protein